VASFNIEEALDAFLADANCAELKLPALDTEQRKQAKKLAEQYPEIKCESYGFGPERRLHLFKQTSPSGPKSGFTKESNSTVLEMGQGRKEALQRAADFSSEGSTAVSGEQSPQESNDSPVSAFDEGVCLSKLYQVRNTFIHIEGDTVDQRAVQSMPHGMFGHNLLAEEMAQAQCAADQGPVPLPEPEPSFTTPPPAIQAPKDYDFFAPGTEVVIEGLLKFPLFNGSRGMVQSLDKETGRYNVQISSTDGSTGQTAKIKGENLRMTVPPPPSFESAACRLEETSKMHARAPDFVPMQCVRMPNMQNPTWQQDPLTIQQQTPQQQSYDPSQYYAYQCPPKIAAR